MADNNIASWMQPATAIGGTLLGIATQKKREKRAMQNTRSLMNEQKNNQKELNEHGQKLQLNTWEKTSYPAQMRMMEEAGLNPALMYGQGGQGGTTGGQGGGSASGGNAPAPMDIGNAIQLGLMNAQRKKIEAETENIKEGSQKTYQEGKGQFLKNVIAQWEMHGTNEIVENTKSKHYGDAGMTPTSIKGKLANLSVEKLEKEIKNLNVTERAKEQGIKLSKEQERQIYHAILQNWAKTGIQAINTVNLMDIIRKAIK